MPSPIPMSAKDRNGRPIEIEGKLRTVLERAVRRWNPHQIWLFGSRARGEAPPDSDWDLLVVVPDDVAPNELQPAAVWEVLGGTGVNADLVPFTMSEFLDDRTVTNTLPYEVVIAGVLLYER